MSFRAKISAYLATRGALIPVAASLCVALLVWLFVARVWGTTTAWSVFGVQAMHPSFADLRNLLDGLECSRRGYDVQLQNPCDPWRRPLNYPSLWLLLAPTGIGQEATGPMGVFSAATFAGSLLILIRGAPKRCWPVLVAVLISPALSLLVERGNTDIWIFALVLAGLRAANARRFLWRGFGYAVILWASCLKLYPIFALLSVARESSRRRIGIVWFFAGLMFASYLFVIRSELEAIRRVLPRGVAWSYGREVLSLQLVREMQRFGFEVVDADLAPLGPGLIVLVLLFAVSLVPRLPAPPEAVPDDERAFLAGSGMFLGTLFVGHNFVYRLVMLVFCLPVLTRWSLLGGRLQTLARSALAAMVTALWTSMYVPKILLPTRPALFTPLIDQWAIWFLALCLATASGLIMFRDHASKRQTS